MHGFVYRLSIIGLALLVNFVFTPATQAIAFQLIASQTEYRSLMAGEYKVISKVIWSDCPYVSEGQKSESKMMIHDINGTLYPEWKAEDWKLVRNKVIDFNVDKSIHWERESKLVKDGEFWFVKSVNEFNVNHKEKELNGKSYHKQYLNGEFVGSYITESYLEKTHS